MGVKVALLIHCPSFVFGLSGLRRGSRQRAPRCRRSRANQRSTMRFMRARSSPYARGFASGWQTRPWLVVAMRRPLPLRAVAALSSQRYCLAMVARLVRPNYSSKATVTCRGDNLAHRAAP